jgi:hypothetical protein
MNKPQTWTVTPAQYAAMEARVVEAGIPISGDSGTASHGGVMASWTYDGATLSVTVLSAPPFCTGVAQRKIAEAVESALA